MSIKPLFEKCIKKNNQRLFMAFVDFRKFYDTINRKNLLYKMLKAGITGNLYKVIKDTLWVSGPRTLDFCVLPNIFAIYACKLT